MAEASISGDFGEAFVAWLLAKDGVQVVRAKTVGFDLFAIDPNGRYFDKDKIVGISVKTRISKEHRRFVPTIPIHSEKIKQAQRIWKVEAWIAVVVGSVLDGKKELACFILPFKEREKFTGGARRKDVIAVSELYKAAEEGSGVVIQLF